MRVAPERMRVAIVRQRYNPYGGGEGLIERALPGLARAGARGTLSARRAARGGGRAARGPEPLARHSGADEKKHDLAFAGAYFRACRRAQRRTPARVEMFQVHAVVDHVQFFRRHAKAAQDLRAHHVRVADHAPQPRMLEHTALGGADIVVVGIERDADALRQPGRGAPDLQPVRVNAVACAVKVAARDALVRLH